MAHRRTVRKGRGASQQTAWCDVINGTTRLLCQQSGCRLCCVQKIFTVISISRLKFRPILCQTCKMTASDVQTRGTTWWVRADYLSPSNIDESQSCMSVCRLHGITTVTPLFKLPSQTVTHQLVMTHADCCTSTIFFFFFFLNLTSASLNLRITLCDARTQSVRVDGSGTFVCQVWAGVDGESTHGNSNMIGDGSVNNRQDTLVRTLVLLYSFFPHCQWCRLDLKVTRTCANAACRQGLTLPRLLADLIAYRIKSHSS